MGEQLDEIENNSSSFAIWLQLQSKMSITFASLASYGPHMRIFLAKAVIARVSTK